MKASTVSTTSRKKLKETTEEEEGNTETKNLEKKATKMSTV